MDRAVLTLAIESATHRVGCALGEGGEVRAAFELTGDRRHAETLVPAISAMCGAAGVSLGDVGCIAADVGPGLFTGLRVGLATARTLAHALDLPTVPVSSLQLLAHPLRHAGRLVAAVIDARRGEVYWQLFRPDGASMHAGDGAGFGSAATVVGDGGVRAVTAAACTPPDELLGELRLTDEPMVLVGDGALRYHDRLADLSDAEWAGREHASPSAATLVAVAHAARLAGVGGEALDLEPQYLRAPDAQINWAQRDAAGAGS